MRNAEGAVKRAIQGAKRPYIKAFVEYYNGTSEWYSDSDFMSGSVSFKNGTTSSGKFDVGGAVISSFEFSLNNWDGKFDNKDFVGAKITAFIGFDTDIYLAPLATENGIEFSTEDGSEILDEESVTESSRAWVKYGTYYFVRHTSVGKVVRCETYDAMKLFDENMLSDNSFNYPIQIGTLVNTIATHNGVILRTTTFTNSTLYVNAPEEDMTERQAISYFAQMCGCYATIDSDGRLAFLWYTDSGYDISNRFSHDIDVNDITITGTKVYYQDGDEEKTKSSGSEGYVIAIKDNPFITKDNAQTIATTVGNVINGMTFRPGTMSMLSNPLVEAGDIVGAKDDKNVDITFIVTNLEYKLSVQETVTCDAEPIERTDLRPYESSVAVERAKKFTRSELSAYDTQYLELSRLMSMSMGMFETREYDDTGAFVLYLHNRPVLAESDTVWKKTADAFAVSTDYNTGQPTWNAGIDSHGNALVNVLSAIGVNANWVQTGLLTDAHGYNSWNLDTGVLTLNTGTKVGSTGNTTLNTMLTSIQANADGLTTKVSTTDYNGNTIASLINQSATTVSISAGKIDLSGYVTISSLGANGTTTVNGSRINGGSIILGGANSGDGVVRVNDANGTQINRLDRVGLRIFDSGTEIGRWNANGISVKKGVIQLGTKSAYDSGNAGVYISSDGVGIGRYKAQGNTYRASVIIPSDSTKEAVILGATYFQNYPPTTGYTTYGLYGDEDGRISTPGAINVNTLNLPSSAATNYLGGTTIINTPIVWNAAIFDDDVHISGDLTVDGSYPSDRNRKTAIKPLSVEESRNFIMGLNPVQFKWSNMEKNKFLDKEGVHHGMVAQDVAAQKPNWAVVKTQNEFMSLEYVEMIADLVKVVQDQQRRIEELERERSNR